MKTHKTKSAAGTPAALNAAFVAESADLYKRAIIDVTMKISAAMLNIDAGDPLEAVNGLGKAIIYLSKAACLAESIANQARAVIRANTGKDGVK